MKTETYETILNDEKIIVVKFTIQNLNQEFGEYIAENTSFDYYVEENLKENEFTMFVLDEEDIDSCIDEMQDLIYEYNEELILEEAPSALKNLCEKYDEDYIKTKEFLAQSIGADNNAIIHVEEIKKEWEWIIEDTEFQLQSQKEDSERGI